MRDWATSPRITSHTNFLRMGEMFRRAGKRFEMRCIMNLFLYFPSPEGSFFTFNRLRICVQSAPERQIN